MLAPVTASALVSESGISGGNIGLGHVRISRGAGLPSVWIQNAGHLAPRGHKSGWNAGGGIQPARALSRNTAASVKLLDAKGV